MRQEETLQQNLEAQDATHGRLVRSVSTVRLAIDAERADMMDSEVWRAQDMSNYQLVMCHELPITDLDIIRL